MRFYALPERLREMLFDVDIANTMWRIGHHTYGLPAKTVSAVSGIAGLVVQGQLPLQQFVPRLIEEAGLDRKTALSVARDINEQIFQPVREELMTVHGISPQGEARDQSAEPANSRAGQIEAREQNAQQKGGEEGAQRKRDELLERLKQSQEERGVDISPGPENKSEESNSGGQKGGGAAEPKATTAAWNGKKIDLTKIPPRREMNGNGDGNPLVAGSNGEINGSGEKEKTVRLKKGPDGYWYEV